MLAASRLQARYRRLRDAIGTGEIGLHFAIGKPLKGFCALVRCESRGTTGGIGPSVFEAAEVCFTLADCGQHIKQVACRACQPVEPGHQQHIARLKRSTSPPPSQCKRLGANCCNPLASKSLMTFRSKLPSP